MQGALSNPHVERKTKTRKCGRWESREQKIFIATVKYVIADGRCWGKCFLTTGWECISDLLNKNFGKMIAVYRLELCIIQTYIFHNRQSKNKFQFNGTQTGVKIHGGQTEAYLIWQKFSKFFELVCQNSKTFPNVFELQPITLLVDTLYSASITCIIFDSQLPCKNLRILYLILQAPCWPGGFLLFSLLACLIALFCNSVDHISFFHVWFLSTILYIRKCTLIFTAKIQ